MEKTKSRRWIWILIVAFVALMATCVLLFFFRGLMLSRNIATVPPCKPSANMAVDANRLDQYCFSATSGTNLTLTISNYKNACTIAGGSLNQKVTAQSSFTLPAGQYKLNCGVPNINALIIIQ